MSLNIKWYNRWVEVHDPMENDTTAHIYTARLTQLPQRNIIGNVGG